MIEDSTIRQVHDRIDIVDVVSRFNITLTRKGAHYVGLCPFHNEKQVLSLSVPAVTPTTVSAAGPTATA